MPNSVLIVDDSRTALVMLARLLSARGLRVDTVESGTEALDYLRHNAAPDFIFLDHMMPGMDGFETLAAFKSDARTAAIPVVMYTSRDGDAYMGQALNQGAVAILHKPVEPDELGALLERLDRMRRSARVPTPAPGRPRAAVTGVIEVPPEFRRRPSVSPPSPASPELAPAPAPGAETSTASRNVLLAVSALLLLAPAGWYYQRYQESEQQRARLLEDNERLQAAQQAVLEQSASEAPAPDSALSAASTRPALVDTLAWALNLHNQYGLNDEPLGDARLNQARELVTRLTAAGFRGSVRFETHIGEFCLVRDEQGNLRQPSDAQAFTRCEVITYPPSQAALLSSRQSPAFARFVAQTTGPVRVVVAAQGNARPLAPYPDSASVQTAGEWNAVARLNQRVEIVLVPAP